MSRAEEDCQEAMSRAQAAGFQLAAAIFGLRSPASSAMTVPEAEAAFCLAARDLTRAVDGLPVDRKPRGWDE
jgi:hypothetical protein